jgi:hypothetical protein
VCFIVDTIYINYYLWKAINNEIRVYRVSIGMASEDYAKKLVEKGWEWGDSRAHCVEQ